MSRRRTAWLIFLACLVVYNANLRYTGSFDSLAASQLPFRILTGHGLTLEDPRGIPGAIRYSYFRNRSGEWICFYPILAPLFVTPLYLPAVLLEKSRPYLNRRGVEVAMEKLSASLITALSVMVLFLTLRKITSENLARWLSIAYAFATSTWAISSQSLWPHGMGELLLALALYLLVDGTESSWRIALLGAVAGLLAANRPTDALFSLALAVIVTHDRRARAWPFFAVAGAIGTLLIAYNLGEFGTPIGGYGTSQYLQYKEGHPFGFSRFGIWGLLGLLFSNRGILFFSPFLLLVFLIRWRERERIHGLKILLAACLAWLLLHGFAIDWVGGYCYGPRYAIQALPILVAALAEPLERLWGLASVRIAFVASIGFSIAIQAIGAFFYPNGDSGNWEHGLWTIRNSSPMLALRAGPEMPDFLFVFSPHLATRYPLTRDEARCLCQWVTQPPTRMHVGEVATIRVRVENLSSTHWSSLGGFFNEGAVKIHTAWYAMDEGGRTLAERSDWLTWRLDPGGSILRDLEMKAPATPGRGRLRIGLEQARMGPFVSSQCAPLQTTVEVDYPAVLGKQR